MAASASDQASNPFIRQLASSERKIRDNALASLRTYLSRSSPFSELDFLKLWKGLFFCMWMQDKAINQQRLARDLAGLADVVSGPGNWLGFVAAFWKTMAREWDGVDSLRMDKYLYLIRCYVAKAFEHFARGSWANGLDDYLALIESVPLNPSDGKIPNGLRYHVIDLWVDELDKADNTTRDAPLDRILGPLRQLEEKTVNKTVRSRTQEALADERLRDWKHEGVASDGEVGDSDSDDGEGGEFGGFDD